MNVSSANMICRGTFSVAIGIGCLGTAAPSLAKLAIYPSEIQLTGNRDRQTIVVQQTLPGGETRDVTDVAALSIDDPDDVISLKGNVLAPLSDGKVKVVATYDDESVEAEITVTDAPADPPLSLRLDVMPVLMKAGCNSGRCHGAARGQDGFRLSLFGYDAAGDYHRLTREMSGRRVNLARPEASLLLTKAIGEAPHSGGERFAHDSASYNLLVRWLEEGAHDDADDIAQPVGIEVFPPEAVLVGSGQTQQLSIRATYSDGTTRDVTNWAVYLSNNDNSAAIDEQGVVTAGAKGEAFVMARFATFTEGVPVLVLPEDGGPEFVEPDAFNDIDQVVYEKLRKLRITPSEVCTDEQFLRRACLDLTGLTPTREQYEAFLSDTSPNKRESLVDELLETDAFVDVWAMRFGELLGIRTSNQVSYKALLGFHNWVRDQIAQNRPLDAMLAELLASSGGTFTSPATNYYQIEANTLQLSENVAQSFLGMRIQCARCHNHPFDRWTMDDYYGFTAFFSQVGFKQSHDPREFIVYDSGQGEIRHMVDNRPVPPKFLGGGAAEVEDQDRRTVLADWIVSNENFAFARNLANIIWAHHVGRGIIEPVDDVRISNPPSNDALLDLLAQNLIDSQYDLRSLVRTICTSRTYQLSTSSNPTNANDFANFSRAQVRRVRAEALLDSISQITNTVDNFPRLPAGARASQIADGATSTYFLSTFGRAPRETVCACEVDVEPNLSQALHLLNGEATNDKVIDGQVIKELLEDKKTPADVIEHLYVLCYSRKPSPTEVEKLLATIQPNSAQSRLQDVFWALLNSKEFLFNH